MSISLVSTNNEEEFEPYSILDLPSEILNEIISFFPTHRDINSFLCTCKQINQTLDDYTNSIKLGTFRLNIYQRKYYKQILETDKNTIHIKMPMSSGKTALAITTAYNHKGPSIIVVPPTILDHWINEFDNMFPDKEKRKFNLYILHSTKGRKSYKEFMNKNILEDNDIILLTSHKSKLWGKPIYRYNSDTKKYGYVDNKINPSLLKKRLDETKHGNIIAIYDEIHKTSINQRFNFLSLLVDKNVTLSADNKKALIKKDNGTEKIVVKDSTIEGYIPEYTITNKLIDGKVPKDIINKCTKLGMSNNLIILLYTAQQNIIESNSRLLLFVPSTNIFLLDSREVNDNSSSEDKYGDMLLSKFKLKEKKSKKKFYFKKEKYANIKLAHALIHFMELNNHSDYKFIYYTNLKSLNEFDKLEGNKCVLIANPRKVQVGININKIAKVLFFLTPFEYYTRTSYTQTIGRFRRVNNTNKLIQITNLVCPFDIIELCYSFSFDTRLLPLTLDLKSIKIPLYMSEYSIYTNKSIQSYIDSCKKYEIDINDGYLKLKYDTIMNTRIMTYNMKNYARHLSVKKELCDDFCNRLFIKNLKMKIWENYKIDPFSVSDATYLYLQYGLKVVRWRNLKAERWITEKSLNNPYSLLSLLYLISN